jgi:uncharacterized membrane protein
MEAFNDGRQNRVKGVSIPCKREYERIIGMFYAVAAVFVVLWILALLTSHTAGGFIHLLLLFAVIVVLFGIRQGRMARRSFNAH